MTTQEQTHTFGPLERRKAVSRFSKAQVACMVAAAVLSIIIMSMGMGGPGVAIGLGVLIVTAAFAFVPVPSEGGASSRTLGEWTPIAVGYLFRFATGKTSWRSSRQELPGVSKEKLPLPRSLKDVRGWTVNTAVGPIGLVVDGRKPVGVMRVHGKPFPLLDPAEQVGLVNGWADFLESFAAAGVVDRVQWVDTTGAEDSGRLAAWADEHANPANDEALASYIELVAGRRAGQARETYVAVRVDPGKAARQVRTFGGGTKGAVRLAGTEVVRVAGMLRDSGMTVDAPLPARTLGQVFRVAVDPDERKQVRNREALGEDPGVGLDAAAPVALDESWSMLRTDSAYHRTYWAEELPRTPQRPDFLLHLLGWTPTVEGAARTLSVTFAPVPTAQAIRQAESSATSTEGEGRVRERFGVRETARHRKEGGTVLSREDKLADGAEEVRLSLFLRVTAPTREALDEACAEATVAAVKARIRLRPLSGQQEDAFTYTQPLCRGVAT